MAADVFRDGITDLESYKSFILKDALADGYLFED